jgi:hypothetical protein
MLIADGQGGMRELADHRFDDGACPIIFVVGAKDAATWMAHLDAEIEARGWTGSGISQIDSAESSGSRTLYLTSGALSPKLEIAWEKMRDKALRLRARPSGAHALTIDDARAFFAAVDTRLRLGTTQREHRSAYLSYGVLPWKGELWLGPDLRLGPPSKHPPALFGPQIVIVDTMVEGIGRRGINAQLQRMLTELRIFLSVVLGTHFELDEGRQGWVWEADQQGRIIDCRIASLGYVELAESAGFPVAGCCPPVPRRRVDRPGTGIRGIWPDMTERWVPDDIEELWQIFRALPEDKREHFVRAGNAYVVAQTMWPAQRTTYASFMVVACEALKPARRSSRGMNIYDVVESLAGAGEGARLRAMALSPQRVRSEHFHRGELIANELGMIDPFQDPSFDAMLEELSPLTRVSLIEWLRCKGTYNVVYLPRQGRQRLWPSIVAAIRRWMQKIFRR